MSSVKNRRNEKKHDFVQILNPRSERYVKIDRAAGVIVSTKQSPGPYKGVPIVRKTK
jgi:hypothetical protein